MNDANLEQVRKLDTILERLIRKMKSQSETYLLGLTATQLFVLRELSLTGEAKSSDIARNAGLSPGAITQVCDELVRGGYVERVRSKEDRRVVFVKLTDAGRDQLRSILTQRAVRLSQLLDKLGEEDATQLIRLLDRLVTLVSE